MVEESDSYEGDEVEENKETSKNPPPHPRLQQASHHQIFQYRGKPRHLTLHPPLIMKQLGECS